MEPEMARAQAEAPSRMAPEEYDRELSPEGLLGHSPSHGKLPPISKGQGVAMSRRSVERADHGEELAWNGLQVVLHEEISRLPERLRVLVILSYLEGKADEEIAALLHLPVGSVKRRLSRASDILQSRLMRLGMARSAAFLVTAQSRRVVFAEIVPVDLVERTIRRVAHALRPPSAESRKP
jgi:RNA polymerase sigma factor (sigma-70 family)